MISEWCIWKIVEESESLAILMYSPTVFLNDLRETTRNFIETIRSPGRDLNLVCLGPENEAGVLTFQLERSAQKYAPYAAT
jgi:hypothetical protein